MPCIAKRGPLARLLLVDDHYPQTLSRQLKGAGDADNAGADHCNVSVLMRAV